MYRPRRRSINDASHLSTWVFLFAITLFQCASGLEQSFAGQSSDTPKAMYDRALAYGADGKFAKAEGLLRKALAGSPGNPGIISCLTLAEDGKAGRISADLGKLLFASTAYGNRGDWSSSLPLAQKAARQGPNYAPAHLFLGVVYMQLVITGKGDRYTEDAVAAYQEATRIRPDYAQAFFNLGVAYAGVEKWQLAEKQFLHAKGLAIRQNDRFLIDQCDQMLSQIAGKNK